MKVGASTKAALGLVSVLALGQIHYRLHLLTFSPGVTTPGLPPGHTMDKTIVTVPLDAFHACDNRVLHLSCLRTIIAMDNSVSIPSAPDLTPKICSDLPLEADETHVMLCLQTPDSLGVLIRKKDEQRFSYLFPAEAESLPLPSSSRIVDRKTVVMSGFYPPRSAKNDAKRGMDGNVGNFIWQYGATRMINPATTVILGGDLKDVVKGEPSAFIIATANCLNLEKDGMLKGLLNAFSNSVETYRVPSVVLGMGIQAEYKSIEDAKSFRLFDFQRKFLELLVRWQAAPAIGVRGKFTQMACKNSGVDSCVATGCPSLLISRELNLGKTLESKWKNVQKRLERQEPIKVALTMPAIHPSPNIGNHTVLKIMTDLLLGIHEKHDAFFVLQMSYDSQNLRNAASNKKLTKPVVAKKYNSSEEWIDDLSQVDLVVSTRIHGGMTGIAAGTPTVVIPTDFRILELVDAMMIPHLPMDKVAKEKGDNLGSILKHAELQDFEMFERNRRDKIRQWRGILDQAGVEMDPSLLRVLDSP